MKQNRKLTTVIVLLLLLFFTGIAIYSGDKLWEISKIYREGDKSYELLQNQVRPANGSDSVLVIQTTTDSSGLHEPDAQISIPPLSIDFELMKEVNSDSAAWLYCPDTPIDYPVMRADDYDWYLRHLPDGTYNANGSLFLDYNASPDFSGRLNIIYGHNMKSEKMFGSLVKYKIQSYYDEHPFMYLYTADGNYGIELKYGCVIGAGDWRDRAFIFENNVESLLKYASEKTTFQSATKYDADDKFIVLSTCSYEFDDARYIVIGILRPEDKSRQMEEE